MTKVYADCLLASDIPSIWEDLKLQLTRLYKHTHFKEYHSDESIFRSLMLGNTQLWLGHDGKGSILAYGITSLQEGMHGRYCAIEHLVSTEEVKIDWLDIIKPIEDHARENHCEFMRVEGRVGWEKLLKPIAYTREATVLRKML